MITYLKLGDTFKKVYMHACSEIAYTVRRITKKM